MGPCWISLSTDDNKFLLINYVKVQLFVSGDLKVLHNLLNVICDVKIEELIWDKIPHFQSNNFLWTLFGFHVFAS